MVGGWSVGKVQEVGRVRRKGVMDVDLGERFKRVVGRGKW